ncbi:MAG: phosphate/phosphite/phosphonate ABC transporter substrate-binding protein [Gemmataceae bacterium]
MNKHILVMLFLLGSALAARGDEVRPLRIGVADSLFGGVPRPAIRAAGSIMKSLVETQSGMKCEFFHATDADELVAQLDKKELDLAVFQGYEYAWLRTQQNEITPLVLIIKHSRHLHGHLMVRADAPARQIKDLRGQVLGMARVTRPHCRLFLDKVCPGEDFFNKVSETDSAEELLDDLVDGLVGCALVDEAAYDSFRTRKPARFAKLRELARSETFPAALIAFRAGTLDEEQVKKFRDGMIASGSSVYGRQLLTLSRTRGFEPIPDDYDRSLADIRKAYPRPSPVRSLLARPMVPAPTVDAGTVSAP